MDKKSKIFFTIFGLLIAGSVAVTYWRIMIKKDYIIEAQADCDPATEKCFVWACDPESDVEGEKCTGDAEKDVWNYKIIKRNASHIPLCDPADENCTALVCNENEPECEYTFCTEENKADQGVECSTVETPVAETPPEETTTAEASTTCAGSGDTCAVIPPVVDEATTTGDNATTSVPSN